jgi:hypothetical protein
VASIHLSASGSLHWPISSGQAKSACWQAKMLVTSKKVLISAFGAFVLIEEAYAYPHS